jgi:hypothetical protein
MAYTVIAFHAQDENLRDIYSFKINFPARELSVEYRNDAGGVTAHGMNLNEQQYHHLLELASSHKFEYYRNQEWQRDAEAHWLTYEPNRWKLQISSDDGLSLLVIENTQVNTEVPQVVSNLVEYVMQIGTFGNYTFSLF